MCVCVRAKVLTCLMGVTGAGKTTYVLAGRKTGMGSAVSMAVSVRKIAARNSTVCSSWQVVSADWL